MEPTPLTYEDAKALIKNRATKRVAPNSLLRKDGGDIVLQHFATDLIRWSPDGSLTLSAGNYRTVTTMRRINMFLPVGFSAFQRNWQWYVVTPDKVERMFENAMRVNVPKERKRAAAKRKAKLNDGTMEMIDGKPRRLELIQGGRSG